MAQWFPAVDNALGGIATALENTAETTGDAAIGLFGLDGLGRWALTLVAILAAAYVLAGVLG